MNVFSSIIYISEIGFPLLMYRDCLNFAGALRRTHQYRKECLVIFI